MSLLLLFNGMLRQQAPPPAGLIDFSLIAGTTVHGLGGTPGIADPGGGAARARGVGGVAGVGSPAGGAPATRGLGGSTRIR